MKKLKFSILAGAVMLAGCSVAPDQLTQAQIQQVNMEDRASAMSDVVPFSQVVTLEEAIARALKYNLDQRVKMLEQSLAAGELEAGKFDMLPKLVADAGYDWRNNFSHRYSGEYIDSSTTPLPDTSSFPDVSADPIHGTYDLRMTWNVLDFGASYYTAKQNGDKLLIASEKRRKALHTLIQNVRTAYWRALAAETLSSRVKATINDAERALVDARKLADERVKTPDESLRYQRNLLENLRLLESVERELASARVELTSLMGSIPGTQFKLVEPKEDVRGLTVAMEDLEARALVQNADLREGFLNARIAAQDTRKAILKLLPGISLNWGTTYDTDDFLVNQRWQSAGVNVSYNLFNLLSASSRMDAADKNEAVAAAQRMALQMAVLTQVHLSAHQFNDALKQYTRADQIFSVDRQLEEIVRGKFAGKMVSEQTAISANVTTILSELRRYQAMSKFQEATGLLQASLGMEPMIGSLDEVSLQDLTVQVGNWLDSGVNNIDLAAN